MINLKNIVISGKEVCPIIEGGKGINGTDGRSSGHFAKEGCVGTISLVSADYYDENGNKLLRDSSDTTVYSYDTFGMLKNMSCPAVLAEQCFITNPSDVESFGTEEGCQRAAQAY